jgi:outer membrane protein assembly factor BamB
LYAVNSSTGELLWKYLEPNGFQSSPAVANGVVYVGSENDTLDALNASTGALVWHYTARDSFISSPAVVNGMVYDASLDGNLYAFHLPNH